MSMYTRGNSQPGPGLAALGSIPPGAPIFVFRGGAATWFGTQLLGMPLQFTGTGWGIFGLWIKWFLLCIITLGIYSFWVYPRLTAWKVEHTVLA